MQMLDNLPSVVPLVHDEPEASVRHAFAPGDAARGPTTHATRWGRWHFVAVDGSGSARRRAGCIRVVVLGTPRDSALMTAPR